MSTRQVWKAFSSYSSVYQTFGNYPIMVNPPRREFYATEKLSDQKLLISSCTSIFLAICCSSVMVIGKWKNLPISKEIPLWIILVQIIFITAGSFILMLDIATCWKRDLVIAITRCGFKLEKDLRKCKHLQGIIIISWEN